MARTKSNGRKRAVDPAKQVVHIIINPDTDVPMYYSTFAEVGHTPHDMSIVFAQVPTRLSALARSIAAENKELTIEPSVQVTVPVTLVPGLIRALERQKQAYEEAFGEINDLEERLGIKR